MTEQRDEKADEKEAEKREEKSPEEKQWEEKYRRDPLGPIIWGLILVWGGLVFLASNMGLLDNILRSIQAPQLVRQISEGWPLVLFGAGIILLIEIVIRLMIPTYRRPIGGTVILAIILFAAALGDLVNWNILWPLIIIGIGIILVMRSLTRKR